MSRVSAPPVSVSVTIGGDLTSFTTKIGREVLVPKGVASRSCSSLQWIVTWGICDNNLYTESGQTLQGSFSTGWLAGWLIDR